MFGDECRSLSEETEIFPTVLRLGCNASHFESCRIQRKVVTPTAGLRIFEGPLQLVDANTGIIPEDRLEFPVKLRKFHRAIRLLSTGDVRL
jgi:hypothetical protein